MDNASEARNTLPMDSRNLDLDWGNAAFDIRHVLTGGFTYSLPAFSKSRLGDGWQVNVVATFQIRDAVQRHDRRRHQRHGRSARTGRTWSAIRSAGIVQPSTGTAVRYFNAAAVCGAARPARSATLGRNQFYGPSFRSAGPVRVQDHQTGRRIVAAAALRDLQHLQHRQLGQSRHFAVELDDLRAAHEHAQRQRRAGNRRGRAAQRAAGGEDPF